MKNKKHSFKDWLIATRPWSFPASSMPIVTTLAYLHWTGESVNWLIGLWTLVTIIVFHAAGNPIHIQGMSAIRIPQFRKLPHFLARTAKTLSICLLLYPNSTTNLENISQMSNYLR